MLNRRSLLRGLLSAPFVARAEWLMPIKVLPLPFLAGDLVRWKAGVITDLPIMLCAEPVVRVEGQHVVVSPGFGHRREWRVPGSMVDLFHGLPCNRVNNPSMRHRLVRSADGWGLSYPGDVPLTKVTSTT